MSIFTQVKEIPIGDVVGRYLPHLELKTSGRRRMARCPFHEDDNPSFAVCLDSNSWRCFGCGAGGSVIDLVIHAQGLNALESAKELARAWNIPFQELTPEEKTKQQEIEGKQQLLAGYIDWAQKQLKPEQREALYKRGLTDETITEYRIGYDLRGSNYSAEGERLKKYQTLGFIGNSGGYLPGGRIVIPVFQYGKAIYVIFWNWRHTAESKIPKYLYPSGWNKPLVGLDLVRKDKLVYLVEGIFDWFSMRQAGYTAVCTLGTNLGTNVGPEHQERLGKAGQVYIFFDNDSQKPDNPGQRAAMKLLREMYPKARNILLPDGKDPNDCYLENPGGFREMVDRLTSQARDAAEVLLGDLEDMSSEEIKATANEGRIKYLLGKLIPLAARLDSEAAKDIMIDRIYRHVKPAGITKKSLQNEVKKARGDQGADTSQEEEKESQQDILLRLAENAFLFKNEFREPFARIDVDDHQETWRCSSRDFKLWLIGKYYDGTGKGPNSEALKATINTISAKAWRTKEEHKLQNRTAELDGAFWYDLADSQWRAAKITKNGWEICRPPVLFQRYSHQQAQPEPQRNGDIFRLLEFVNLKDEGAKILYLVSVVTSFIPGIPHIVFVVFGGEGTGKSTACKATRLVIDPSGSLTCGCCDDKREFVQYMAHNYAVILENLSGMSKNLSDAICSAVTGDGASKRMLHTDDSDVIYNYRRVFIINGINNVVTQADLLRRSVLFSLEPVVEKERIPEKVFWERFEEARPVIMGGVFNALAEAMRIYPEVSLTGLYDMADYTLWGYAVAEALGLGGENFLTAYAENRGKQVEEAIGNHPVASAITVFMRDKAEWNGKPSELLLELENIANREKISIKAKSWPKAANSLTRRLNEAKTILGKSGIKVDTLRSRERDYPYP